MLGLLQIPTCSFLNPSTLTNLIKQKLWTALCFAYPTNALNFSDIKKWWSALV